MSGQSRLGRVIEQCKSESRTALIGFLTAGDPNVAESRELLLALAGQVDILEIGMPFSDPMADGPVIQAASERALAAGTHINDVLELTAAVRQAQPDLGIVLMGYANVPYAMGFDRFAEKAKSAGADGVLLVDIPPEEGDICDASLKANGLERILLLSPTSTDERIRLACEYGSGFIYYVSLTGITGAEMGEVEEIRSKVEHIKAMAQMPVCVGFGIKTPEQARQIADFADGVVIGSHFVSLVNQAPDAKTGRGALVAAAADIRQAMKAEA